MASNAFDNLADRAAAPADASRLSVLVQRLVDFLRGNFLRSVGAQALVSGFHFCLNLMLVRELSLYAYGVFAFTFVLAMFGAAVNNALISTPLTVYTPVIEDAAKRGHQESLFGTLNLCLFAAMLAVVVVYGQGTGLGVKLSLGIGLYVAVYSARQFSRSLGYARLRPLVTAAGDATYVASGVALTAMVFMLEETFTINTVSVVLMALAAANLAAMIVEASLLHAPPWKHLRFNDLSDYRLVWIQSRWALTGALTTLFLMQAHGVIINATNGPSAFAPLAAGFVLFGPVRVALLTWQNMVKPELAMALANDAHEAVRVQIRQTVLLMAAAVLALGAGLMLFWPWIHELLYAQRYAQEPMAHIVALWFAITFMAALYNAPSAALQALRDFRVLAVSSMIGAVISGVLVWLTLAWYEPHITLYGLLVAETFMAIYITRLLAKRLGTRAGKHPGSRNGSAPDGTRPTS